MKYPDQNRWSGSIYMPLNKCLLFHNNADQLLDIMPAFAKGVADDSAAGIRAMGSQ